jgi:hypothetical protein
MAGHIFCRDLALERGEPLEGTGRLEERVLLLAWPRGAWRSPREASLGMSVALGNAVRKARSISSYVILVDRVGASETVPKLTAFPESISITPPDEKALIEAIHAWTRGETLAGQREERITIVCCTDSRSDACCAKYGFATYKELVAQADPHKFNILQSSHIGGCRFATALAVVSRRQRYGRLVPDDVTAFLNAVGRGKTYLAAFKGNADLLETEQVAELAALRWAAKAGSACEDVVLNAGAAEGDSAMAFEAEIAGERLAIRLESKIFDMHSKCTAITRDPPRRTKRWLVKEVTALGPAATSS